MTRMLWFPVFLLAVAIHPAASPANPPPGGETVILQVPGMTCRVCPITVRKALEKVPGVLEVKADLASKTATVSFDPARTDVEALTRATANAGYPSTPQAP